MQLGLVYLFRRRGYFVMYHSGESVAMTRTY